MYESRDLQGRVQIFLLGADGTERQLTETNVGAHDPTWSPDGTRIAFATRLRGDKDGQQDTDIFVMHTDGSHIRRLGGTAGYDLDPDWSPDGTRVAFHGELANSEGTTWDNNGLIWVVSVRTGKLTRISPRRDYSEMDPAWSPDGRWIAYTQYRNGNTINGRIYSAELWLMRSDGTDRSRVSIRDPHRVNENPSWSPDGRLIVFERHDFSGGHNRILVVDPFTGRVHTILRGAEAALPPLGDDTTPSWGPNGTLMSLPSRNSAPTPDELPAAFQAPIAGMDATITLTRSTCELDGVDGPIRPAGSGCNSSTTSVAAKDSSGLTVSPVVSDRTSS